MNADAVPEFISQRRRWLNGAFFAAVYSLVHFKQIWHTSHSISRKVLLHIEFVYQFVSLAFTFFSLVSCKSAWFSEGRRLTAVGQLLPNILLHCWISLGSENRSLRPQYRPVHLRNPPLRLCSFDLHTVHPVNGESTSRVSLIHLPVHLLGK